MRQHLSPTPPPPLLPFQSIKHQMMESSSSSSAVKVVVRMRPAATLTKKPSAASYSIKNDQQSIVTIANNHRQISLKVKDNLIRSFTFDGCFDGGSTQEEIYAEVGRQQLKVRVGVRLKYLLQDEYAWLKLNFFFSL